MKIKYDLNIAKAEKSATFSETNRNYVSEKAVHLFAKLLGATILGATIRDEVY